MIYFTSDLHLGHEAVIRMQNRPFANADEMNRMLIENYNSVVHKNDTVYLLGDICFRIVETMIRNTMRICLKKLGIL